MFMASCRSFSAATSSACMRLRRDSIRLLAVSILLLVSASSVSTESRSPDADVRFCLQRVREIRYWWDSSYNRGFAHKSHM